MYYKDLLQLDFYRKSKNFMQDIEQILSSPAKFPWRMMTICLEDVKVLIEFFKNNVNIKKGVSVLLERIEDVGELQVTSNVHDFTGIPSVQAVHSMQLPKGAIDPELLAGSGIDSATSEMESVR